MSELFSTTRGVPIVSKNAVPQIERYDDVRLSQTPTIVLPQLRGKAPLRGAVAWGTHNNLPGQMIEQVRRNPLLSAAMEFKSLLMCGNGIIPVKRTQDGDKWHEVPCYEYPEVNEFLEENDINGWFAEQCLDQTVFNNAFSAIVYDASVKKITELHHLEAYFSRWEEANPTTGEVEHHFYSNQWENGTPADDVLVSRVLPSHYTTRALRYITGIETDPRKQFTRTPETRFIVPVHLPSLGRPYYSRAWWQSLADSGWLDFVHEIPEYKRALLKNATVLKYHVKLHSDFWRLYYAKTAATTDKQKHEAQEAFFANLDKFLSNNKNSGLSFVSEQLRDGNSQQPSISIEPIKNETGTGGEMLADLEEVSNILAYGMGVHPSLIGASPGKNKSINGTEARELFIIKQGLLAPIRERLLRPLYVIKRFNGWPDDLHFRIANLELTTLDENTGAKRVISQPALD